MIAVRKAMCDEPKFRVREKLRKSTWRRQRAGIRQVCPLSPDLFVCVLTVIFHDIHEEVGHTISGNQLFSHFVVGN